MGVWADATEGGWGLARALSGPRWSRAAALSYLMYLLHPIVYMVLYSAPYLLAPPSAAAAGAAAAAAGPNPPDAALHALGTACAAVVRAVGAAVPAGVRAGALAAWTAFSWPTSETGISLGGFAVYTLVALLVTAVLAQARARRRGCRVCV